MNIGNDSSVSTLVVTLEELRLVVPECVELLLNDTLDCFALASRFRFFLRMLPVDAMRTAGRPMKDAVQGARPAIVSMSGDEGLTGIGS